MGFTRWRLPAGVGASAALALLVAGCPGDNVPQGPTHLALYPECPTHPFTIQVFQITATEDTIARDTLKSLPNAGATSGIPEYHDCQRLGLRNERSYSTLAGVFAYEALGSLFAPGVAAADPRAAAEIVAFDGGYQPLSIELGFNCLYLWKEGGDWTARILSAGGDADLCLRRLGEWPPTAGQPLRVDEEVIEGMLDEDYPPVARWEWDPVVGAQFIGIRCGAAWCSVRGPGPGSDRLPERGGGVQPNRPSTGPLTGVRWERAKRVRGWYDEQRLAIEAAPGKLIMSEVVGAIIPHPELGTRTDVAAYADGWNEVARVVLDPAAGVDQYATKLGLRPGINVIEMQQFSQVPNTLAAPTCPPDKDGLVWLARVTPDRESPVLRCVTRNIHPPAATPVAAPGTARWRWDPNDEKTWVTCPKGCCTVE